MGNPELNVLIHVRVFSSGRFKRYLTMLVLVFKGDLTMTDLYFKRDLTMTDLYFKRDLTMMDLVYDSTVRDNVRIVLEREGWGNAIHMGKVKPALVRLGSGDPRNGMPVVGLLVILC